MAFFAGIRDTGDWGTGERPQSYRGNILMLNPNGRMPLFALTDKLSSEKVDDPQYHWWNERNTVIRLTMNATAITTSQTLTVASGALQLRPGQILKVDVIGTAEPSSYIGANVEMMYLSSVTSDTVVVVKRGQFGTTPVALTTGTTFLTALGTAFGENSLPPSSVTNNPTKYTNYTQIFRTNFGLSRTADQTFARTGDAYKQDRERALFAHGRNIEFQFLYGLASEGIDASGFPIRTTGGIRSFLTSNVTIFQTTPTENTFLDATYPIWNYDTRAGDERLCFCGNGFLNSLNKMATSAPKTQIVQTEVVKMYGMNLNTWQLPQGKLGFKTHPLMNNHAQYNNAAFILDPTALKYRYLQDTKFVKNQQTPGQDGMLDGWLTECGLEVLAEETCAYIGNFVV
jgi:hypothetical protein